MAKKPKRKRYSDQFKIEAVQLVEQRGDRTIAEVAASLGVAESMLHTWRKQFPSDRVSDRGESPDEELARLRRENQQLRRDRDALAKSIAVFVRDRK